MGEGLVKLFAAFHEAWLLLLSVGCLGLHPLAALAHLTAHRSSPRALVLEVMFGVVNPLTYLLFIQPAWFRQWTPWWLEALQWATFASYWGLRLLGSALPRDAARRSIRVFLLWVAALIIGLSVRDLLVNETSMSNFPGLFALLPLQLYVLPVSAAVMQFRGARHEETWATSGFFLPRLPIAVWAAVGFMAVACMLATTRHASQEETRDLLARNQALVTSTALKRHLDPRLLAAIVAVTQEQIASTLQVAIENFVADVWLTDDMGHLLLAESLDPSLGIAQIKPDTLMEAYALTSTQNGDPSGYFGKGYRALLRRHIADFRRIPYFAVKRSPSFSELPGQGSIVDALRTEPGSIDSLGFLLDVYATQWESADPNWSIRKKPEILATLFQIGFSHSRPHANPEANDFGNRVRVMMDDPWIVEHFTP